MAMAARVIAALLLGACVGPALAEEATCAGDSAACTVEAEDASSLLALQRRQHSLHGQEPDARSGAPPRLGVPASAPQAATCPGSGNACAGNQCCPGYGLSDGKTFPCPSAAPDFDGCETRLDLPTRFRCPGSSHAYCWQNECCPGTGATDGKTFPCPTADRDYDKCQVGQSGTVAALLGALTREEKYGFVRGSGWVNGTWDILPGYFIGDAGLHERFGIPSLNMEDNGQGFRTVDKRIIPEVTSWPCTLAVASSWSEEDTGRWAVAMGKEFRAKGANTILGPGLNVARVALGGRNAEYVSGESPYLGARLVVPWVEGVQSQRVLAVMKHWVNNNQETNRDNVDAIVDQRTEFEVYYPPFKAAIDAGCAAAMCSYNLVNGIHSCGNPNTLLTDLREKLGFEGFVQSDWWALHSFAAEQGVDQEMPGDATATQAQYYTDQNLDTLSNETLNGMVRPMLAMMLRYGLFEPEGQVCQPPHCDYSLYEAVATTPEHQALNRELATKAVTLLKNDGKVLPLGSNVKKIALLGSACNASQNVTAQLEQWDLGSYYNIGGSGRVIANDPVSILAGLTDKCQDSGCEILFDGSDKVASALRKAEGADVAIICGGTTSTEGGDRESLAVDQQGFLVAVAAALTTRFTWMPTVSITLTPGVIVMPWIGKVQAALNLFHAGSYTGTALADVIFGDVNPSAKLPVTFPVSENQTIMPCEEVECPYTEGLFVGYAGLEDEPVTFPFGHGLSYTTFAYSNFEAQWTKGSNEVPEDCQGAMGCVSVTVTNDGDVAGVEVAQLYMGYPEGLGEPKKLLRGFFRTGELKPGESEDIDFPLQEEDLSTWDANHSAWTIANGNFNLWVGSSSRDLRLSGSLSNSPQGATCPGSGNACTGNQCCPGYGLSGGKTFPCPSAAPDFNGCETRLD